MVNWLQITAIALGVFLVITVGLLIGLGVSGTLCFAPPDCPQDCPQNGISTPFQRVGSARPDGHDGPTYELWESKRGNQYSYELRENNQTVAVLKLAGGTKAFNGQKIVMQNPAGGILAYILEIN